MNDRRKPEKSPVAPGRRSPPGDAPGSRNAALLSRVLPYGFIAAAVAIFYWPILNAGGWLWNDFPEQNFIYRLFAAVSLKQGVFPFWNPYVFSGMPFFADVQAAVLYPLNLLLTPFASADWLNPLLVEYEIIGHILLAGIFMYWLCRDLNIGIAAALFGGMAFMFSGTLTAHIFHTNLIQTAAWFPLIVLLFRRMMERRSLLYLALCSLTLAAAFLAGYPQLMLYTYYWLGVYGLFLIFRRSGEKHVAVASAGVRVSLFAALVCLSIGMTAVQLLPTNELGKNSSRPSLEFHESCEGSVYPYRFVTLLVPKFFGTPTSAYWGIGAHDVRGGVHSYWETAIYCGVIPLLLAAVALIFSRTPFVMFLALMALVSFLLSMGDSFFLYKIAYSILPGFNRFRIPGRFAFMINFSVSILAAFGLQALMATATSGAGKQRRVTLACMLGFAAAAIIGAALVGAGLFRDDIGDFMLSSGVFGSNAPAIFRYVEQEIYPALSGACWLFAALAAASATLIALRLAGKITATVTAIGAIVIAMADFLAYGYGFASVPESPEAIYRMNSLTREFQNEGRTEYFRINSRDSNPGTDDLGGSHMVFRKNEGSVHRLFLMEGYNPLRLRHELAERGRHVLDILNVKYTIRIDPSSGSMGLVLNPTCLPRARMVYRYRVMPDADILPALRADSFDHVHTLLLERQPSIASCEGCDSIPWKATITGYTLNGIDIDVETGRDGFLVLSEIHYPCWKATVDGHEAPLHRADYALRAIEVPAGKHIVRCFYEDVAFRKGWIISLFCLGFTLLTLGLGLAATARKKTRPDTATSTETDHGRAA